MSEPIAEHPDADVLCDLDEGLLAGRGDEADVQAHVAACASCADFIALLGTTREQLAAVATEPMPADVATRIDAALATEAARGAPGAPDAPDVSDTADEVAVVTPLRPARRSARSRWLPATGAVAAGIALLMAGAVGLGIVNSTSGGNQPSSANSERQADGGGGAPANASVRNYTSESLASGVRMLVAGQAWAGVDRPAGPSATPLPLGTEQDTAAPPDLDRLRAPVPLAACVAELAGKPGVSPLAVDYAAFEGQPAVVIVLPDADPALLQAWVVGPACAPGNTDLRRREVVRRAG